MHIRYVWVLIVLAGCSGDGNPKPTMQAEPGGIWFGTRPNGTAMVMFVSEDASLRILDEFGNQGFGKITVTDRTAITASYKVVPEYGHTLIDGSDSADCTFAGTIQERQSMTIEVDCQTSTGGQFGGGDINLTYDAGYELDSSIARIAGTYQNPDAAVVTVDANGMLFGQDPASGCIVNGQVSLIDTEWNLYGISLVTEACMGAAAPFNGAAWSGTAAIAIVDGVDYVVGGLIADVDGQDWSLVIGWQKF